MTCRWEAFQLAYDLPQGRCERLVACAQCLGVHPWFWVDVDGATPLLEIGVRSHVSAARLRDAAGVSRVEGGPRALQPRLFPLGLVPEWFAPLLAQTGLSALSALVANPEEPVPWIVVSAQLRQLYGQLIPDAGERAEALAWYERWLSSPTPAVVANPSAECIHAVLVARAAHIQVVRLRGPSTPREEEAQLIRDLLNCRPMRASPALL